jgi:hypothetical protein
MFLGIALSKGDLDGSIRREGNKSPKKEKEKLGKKQKTRFL